MCKMKLILNNKISGSAKLNTYLKLNDIKIKNNLIGTFIKWSDTNAF